MNGDSEQDDIFCKKRKMGASEDSSSDSDESESPKKKPVKFLSEDDAQSQNSKKGLYGLKRSFLKSLGITPPLDKWVQITNFRCDRQDLRDVLELAGRVVLCNMVSFSNNRCARAMYSHPLEAVQAVSMLNGQKLYGNEIKVIMIQGSFGPGFLPNGLNEVGPGLGAFEKPLRDIVEQYCKFLKNQPSNLNLKVFRKPDEEDLNDILMNVELSEDDSEDSKSIISLIKDEFSSNKPEKADDLDGMHKKGSKKKKNKSVSGRASETSSKSESSSYLGPGPIGAPLDRSNQYGPGPIAQPLCPSGYVEPQPITQPLCPSGYVQPQPIGPMHRPPFPQAQESKTFDKTIGPMNPVRPMHSSPAMGVPVNNFIPVRQPGPMMNGPIMPPGQFGHMMPNMPNPNLVPTPMPGRPPVVPGQEGLVVSFSNLPPTTTFQLLSDKVSMCGQVLSLQLTTPGCAVARFGHKAHAEVCYQLFKGKFIDGCVVDARID